MLYSTHKNLNLFVLPLPNEEAEAEAEAEAWNSIVSKPVIYFLEYNFLSRGTDGVDLDALKTMLLKYPETQIAHRVSKAFIEFERYRSTLVAPSFKSPDGERMQMPEPKLHVEFDELGLLELAKAVLSNDIHYINKSCRGHPQISEY